jgi:hypothetical protein
MSYSRRSAVLPRPLAPAARVLLLGSATLLPAAAAAAALLSCSRRSAMVVSGRALSSNSSCCTNLQMCNAVAAQAVLSPTLKSWVIRHDDTMAHQLTQHQDKHSIAGANP